MLLNKYLMVILMVLATAQVTINAQTPSEKVRVFKDGNSVYIRSYFSPTQDVVMMMGKGQNDQINFSTWTTLIPSTTPDNEMTPPDAVCIHSCSDDSTPWVINNTYIGANHGLMDGRSLEAKGYNFSNQDVGSMWIDSANNKFYVMKVLNPTNIWILSDNLSSSEIWKFNTTISGKQLKNAVSGQVCQIEKNDPAQLRPIVRIRKLQYLVDGETPLPDKVSTLCNFLNIREESDIINPVSLLNEVKANPGKEANFTSDKLTSILSDDITYRLGPMGSCIIEYRSKANCNFNLVYMGFIQSSPLNKGAWFDSYTCYVPKSLPFEKNKVQYDFRAGQDFMPALPVGLSFNASEKNVKKPLNLPSRCIQIIGKKVDGKITSKVGYAFGYSPLNGVSKLDERSKNTENSLYIHTTQKSYPSAIDKKLGLIPAGKEFHCIAYRQYFDPTTYPNTNGVYYHKEGDSYIVYIDYQKEVAKDTIKLPDYLVGKKISLIEASIDLSLPETVPAEGLTISIDKPYAYIVLKLD